MSSVAPYKKAPEEVDLDGEERAIRIANTVALLLTLGAFGLGFLGLGAIFEFPRALEQRLAFALQASVFVLIWVLVGVFMVSTGRRKSPADIGGSAAGPPSEGLAIKVAFLQNSLEQAVLAAFSYLAFASLLGGPFLAMLAASVLLFAVGRILFYRGYRRGARGRALGMSLTMTPTVLLYLFVVSVIATPLSP